MDGATLDVIRGSDFVNPTTQFLEPGANGAQFATNTRGDTSSLRLTLSDVQPRARLVLDFDDARETGSAPPFYRPPADIEGTEVILRLGDLRAGRLDHAMPADGYPDDGITLRRIIREGVRDVSFTYTDTDDPRQGDYYYVRVRQVNDAMAWSSPIWVGGYPSR